MLTGAFIIGLKDLHQRLRDRSALVMAVVAPLGLVLILNATLGSAAETTKFEFAVLNADQAELGVSFESLMAQLEAEKIATIVRVSNRAELDGLIGDGALNAGFVIPEGFTESARAGEGPEIVVVGDRSSPISVSVANAIASSFAAEVDYVRIAVGSVVLTSPGPVDVQQLITTAQQSAPPIIIDTASQEGHGLDIAGYYAISLSIFFLFFTVQFGVLSLLEEEEAGTLARLRSAPISPWSIIMGKLLSSFVLGVLSTTVMVIATSWLMGVRWGNPAGVAVFVVLGVLAATAIVSLVLSVAHTAEQAGAYASMGSVVLGLLGGVFFPIDQSSGFLRAASFISPHRWLLEGFREISYGSPIASLGGPILIILGFIVVTGSVGLLAATRGVSRQ